MADYITKNKSGNGFTADANNYHKRVIVLMTGDAVSSTSGEILTNEVEESLPALRLERVNAVNKPDPEDILYEEKDNEYYGAVVVLKNNNNKGSLPTPIKPHVITSFYTYLRDLRCISQSEKKEEDLPLRKEKRELQFWFYKGFQPDEKIYICSHFLKLLIEPETFPLDGVTYVKKVIYLMQQFDQLKRMEIRNVLERIVPPIQHMEEPLIENFITVLTPAIYDYQFLPEVPVSGRSRVHFRLRAKCDGHVALSYVYGNTERQTYEIDIGSENNRRCAIRYGGRGRIMADNYTPGVLDANEFCHFWVSWGEDHVKLGSGTNSDADQQCLVAWTGIADQMKHSVNLMSVSTGPDSTGRWEFVEYIRPNEPIKESKRLKRLKVLKSLVWYAKKEKILLKLEEAFPASLDMAQLMRESRIKLNDMLETVVFLKNLNTNGSLVEKSKGNFSRTHAYPTDLNHKFLKVSRLPSFKQQDEATIAILTPLYCDKTSIDSMFDTKTSYALDLPHGPDIIEDMYTVGKMAGCSIVTYKLPKFNPEMGSTKTHTDAIERLLERFSKVRQIIVVSVCGAVPHYNEHGRHVKLGDVVVSRGREQDGVFYISCADFEDLDADPTGNGVNFYTSTWTSVSNELDKKIDKIQEMSQTTERERGLKDTKNWEFYLDSGMEQLTKFDQRFFKPSKRTDKLMAYTSRDQQPVEINHPTIPNISRKEEFTLPNKKKSSYNANSPYNPGSSINQLASFNAAPPIRKDLNRRDDDSEYNNHLTRSGEANLLRTETDNFKRTTLLWDGSAERLHSNPYFNVRFGPVAHALPSISRDPVYRMILARENNIFAYDQGLCCLMNYLLDCPRLIPSGSGNSGLGGVALVLGACDYFDGTKGKTWQPYASLAAASVAKALIKFDSG